MSRLTVTIPYSVRISRELLDEMRRLFDRMEPPKPTFSAVLRHIVKLGWDSYKAQKNGERWLQNATGATHTKRVQGEAYPRQAMVFLGLEKCLYTDRLRDYRLMLSF